MKHPLAKATAAPPLRSAYPCNSAQINLTLAIEKDSHHRRCCRRQPPRTPGYCMAERMCPIFQVGRLHAGSEAFNLVHIYLADAETQWSIEKQLPPTQSRTKMPNVFVPV